MKNGVSLSLTRSVGTPKKAEIRLVLSSVEMANEALVGIGQDIENPLSEQTSKENYGSSKITVLHHEMKKKIIFRPYKRIGRHVDNSVIYWRLYRGLLTPK